MSFHLTERTGDAQPSPAHTWYPTLGRIPVPVREEYSSPWGGKGEGKPMSGCRTFRGAFLQSAFVFICVCPSHREVPPWLQAVGQCHQGVTSVTPAAPTALGVSQNRLHRDFFPWGLHRALAAAGRVTRLGSQMAQREWRTPGMVAEARRGWIFPPRPF